MLYIAADHRGYKLKEEIKSYLAELGQGFEDVGNTEYDPDDDYPDFASVVGEKVSSAPNTALGIVICGSGGGVDATANKYKGVRSSIGFHKDQARDFKEHDATNVLALSANFTSTDDAKAIVKAWLEARASDEKRHVRRRGKIQAIEEKNMK